MRGCFLALIFLFAFVGFATSGYASKKNEPAWLKRLEFSVQCETDQKPIFYLQAVEPLYQDEKSVVFYQPRVSLVNGNFMYNLGLGYRWLESDNLLLGVNVFGDYQDFHEHGRLGIGLEALSQIWEMRLNSYFGITSKRVVEQSAYSSVYEHVANGLDLELGMPVPHLPWLRVYGSGFWYNFENFSDKVGWKLRLEAKLSHTLLFDFYTWDDNKGEQEYGGRLRCRIRFDKPSDLLKIFKSSKEAFPKRNLKEQMLKPVERNYNIVVEKWSESGNIIVEIARGN